MLYTVNYRYVLDEMVNIWAIQSLKDGAGCVLSIVRTSVMVTGACFIGFSLAATIGDTRSFLVLGGRLCHDQLTLTSFVSDHVLIRAPWFRRETHRQTDRRKGRETKGRGATGKIELWIKLWFSTFFMLCGPSSENISLLELLCWFVM